MEATVLLQQQLPAELGSQGHNPAIVQEAIDKLDAFQAQARSWLFQALSAHAKDASAQQLADALVPLCDCTAYLLPDTPEAQLAPHVQHFRDLTAQLAALEQQLAQEEQAAGVHAQVAEFDTLLLKGQYGDAAWSVLGMGRSVRAEQEGGAGTKEQHRLGPKALEELQGSYEACEARLSQVLAEASAAVLQVDSTTRQLVLRNVLPPASAPISELWAALQARGELQHRLSTMADDLVRLVLEPVLAHGATIAVQPPSAASQVDGSQAKGTAHVRWAERAPGQSADPESCCQKLLKLIAEHLFDWDEDLLRKWGEMYWRRMSDAYVRLHAAPFVKSHADDSAACSAKADAARGLEEFAESLGIVDEPYLGPAVDALSRQVLCARQQRYLERARQLILSPSGQQAPVRVGLPLSVDQQHCSRVLEGQLQDWEALDPPSGCSAEGSTPLACGQYSVSPYVPALLELMEQALQDAAASGEPTIAEALVAAVSKIALMARILPNQQQLQQAPQLALLHHNDLRHLADALLLFPPCFGPELDPLLAQGPGAQSQEEDGGGQGTGGARTAGVNGGKLSFVADAALLLQAAEDVMMQQLRSQHQVLSELCEGLAQLHRLGRGASAQAGLEVRKTVTRLLHSMGRVGRIGAAVLAPEPLVHLASALLGSVCSVALGHVLSRRDIGIDDIKDLKDVLHPLAHETVPLLLGGAPQAGPGNGTAKASDSAGEGLSGIPMPLVCAALSSRCTPLRKLQSLLVLLDAGLKDFVAGWQEGRQQRDSWDKGEVLQLVMALFEDSDYRRQALTRIREHGIQ